MDDFPDIAEQALVRARDAVGGPVALAAALNQRGASITSQAVSQWRRVPAERVLEVERVTGISRHELRPDIYPPDEGSSPSSPAAPSEATGN